MQERRKVGFEIMKVLTKVRQFKDGDCTFSLMSNGKVHINNHITGKSSMWVCSEKLLALFKQG